MGKKPVIGLMGAVGSGKSSVAACFAQFGCAVIDADRINHDLLDRPDVIAKLTALWGKGILQSDGRIDRQALGNIVFASKYELDKLTAIVHPAILQRQAILMEQYQQNPDVKAIVLDVPLLVESGWERHCDAMVFIETSETIRHERIRRKLGWNQEKIKNVENSQILLDKKRIIADYTIDNNSNVINLTPQVEKILFEIYQQMG